MLTDPLFLGYFEKEKRRLDTVMAYDLNGFGREGPALGSSYISEPSEEICEENTQDQDNNNNLTEDHPELKTSNFSKDFTFKKGQALWEEISSILNAMPGANKGWIKWRKTWHDIKNAVKTKSATIRRHLDQTGGGPPINEEITNEDQKILNLISPVVIEGMPEVAESMTVFTMPPKKEVKPSTSSSFVPVEVDVIVSNPRVDQTVDEPEDEPLVTPRVTPNEAKGSRFSKTPVRVQRLDRSIGASEKMAKIMEGKNIIYENYLKEKISLMRRDCEAKERIASALEHLTASLNNNSNHNSDSE
ncbi:unnamed protein product [Ceutorhynchus assimilis]|uniref:Regulatory protein zeste n=1 Tax=Ceutorhynchus assimilis TaxID=467358 RepID=A0A9N9QG83_9CUCU|nr:unnamed protein product [Ceutorhynchus assimilis]